VSCGLEARISGVLGDAAVTFFDPLYCLNRDRYRPGAIIDVELAGIAYSLGIVPAGTTLQSAVGDVPMAVPPPTLHIEARPWWASTVRHLAATARTWAHGARNTASL
jgi:hypothetical protein